MKTTNCAWDTQPVPSTDPATKPARRPEPPKSKAQTLFQGQLNPKKRRKITRLEQWVEVRIVDGHAVTELFPSNALLIQRGQRMLPPPEFVYRRLNFPDGIPDEYAWTCPMSPDRRTRGGCGLQRMTIDTWLELIEKEALRPDGHIGPTGAGNLPRPPEHGECTCPSCTLNTARLKENANE